MFSDKTDMELTAEFGVRMRRARLRLNITQAELALKAGISLASVREAEVGGIRTMRALLAILRTLGRLKDFELLMDMPDVSPRELAMLKGRRRRRATGTRVSKTSQTQSHDRFENRGVEEKSGRDKGSDTL